MRAYVDWLAGQLSAVPGFTMRTDRLTFSRWLAREFALTVSVPASMGRSGPVPLTYYYPYSGQTPPGGVTGRLVDLGLYPLASGFTEAFWAPPGGIALVRTAPPVLSLDLAQTATGGYVPGQISIQAAADYAAYAAGLTNPAWQGIFEPVPLLDAKNAGVLGVVVAWTGVPDDEAVNQYNPFTTPIAGARYMAFDLRFLSPAGMSRSLASPAQVVLACVDHGGPWLREDRSRERRPGRGKLAEVVPVYLGTPGSGAS